MYNVQCTLYSVRTVYNVQCTMYNVQHTLCTVQCTSCTILHVVPTVHTVLPRVYVDCRTSVRTNKFYKSLTENKLGASTVGAKFITRARNIMHGEVQVLFIIQE